jgi:hypothetical protein
MRQLDIITITPSTNPAVPSTFEVAGDFTSIFHGKEWIDEDGVRFPFYDTVAGGTLLVATTFDVIGNPKYAGRYTVYTKPTLGGLDSSTYQSGPNRTIVRVNEAMPAGTSGELIIGKITRVSTYLLSIAGESDFVLTEQQSVTDRPIELSGRLTVGWGESMMQNMLRQAQSFAGPTAPENPFLGQLWLDTTTSVLMIRGASAWSIVNAQVFGASYRFTQGAASTTWTVNHGLALPAPFHAGFEFFVDTPGGLKPILPLDVTFNSANQLTATFSNASTGYAIVRA